MRDVMLTTKDNPYNPFDQFDEWFAFDTQKGYNTCGYLARVCVSTDELGENEELEAVETAIDEILSFDVLGIYKKVTKDVA